MYYYPYLPFTIGYTIYDDGCHLRNFARNPCRKDTTSTSQQLACLEIVVDKMHIAGHKDPWCLQNCDSRKIPELQKVNYWVYAHRYSNSYNSYHLSIQVDTEVCEQTFYWLSRYSRMTRSMNRSHFTFFVLYVSDLHNQREEQKLRNAGLL